jgi:hypothetical protein
VPPQRRTGPSWWRRNVWGLVALVPAFALALGPGVKDGYDEFWKAKPHQAISATADGWVNYAGARMRLTDLVRVTDLVDFDRKPVTLPDNMQAWRARIAFQAPDDSQLGGCRILLEDRSGRTFGSEPGELSRVKVPLSGCSRDTTTATSGPSPAQPGSFETVAYFVVPVGTQPVAVRITLLTELPSYALLTAY